jgi:DNA-binding CsgD family transcriptional regulator
LTIEHRARRRIQPTDTSPVWSTRPAGRSVVGHHRVLGELTPREHEVAALIAQGFTNDQIAQRLVVTTGTVANHVAHILAKLGVSSRVHVAVTYATRSAQEARGLLGSQGRRGPRGYALKTLGHPTDSLYVADHPSLLEQELARLRDLLRRIVETANAPGCAACTAVRQLGREGMGPPPSSPLKEWVF